jgi:hypothetical protein
MELLESRVPVRMRFALPKRSVSIAIAASVLQRYGGDSVRR